MYQSNFKSSSATDSSISSSGAANGTSGSSSSISSGSLAACGSSTGGDSGVRQVTVLPSRIGCRRVLSQFVARLDRLVRRWRRRTGTATGAASAGVGGIIPSGDGLSGVTLSGSLVTLNTFLLA